MHLLDYITFGVYVVGVIAFALYKSRKGDTSEDYFLASRSLLWYLIGFSLIAANISTEHFVGMSGAAAGRMGLAVASYEWVAAITLVFVAIFLLPTFLKAGIYTIPQFLEYRYNEWARLIMSVATIAVYVGVSLASVLYSGAVGLNAIFGLDMVYGIIIIALIASAYTISGGLKAVVWADLIQGSLLIAGGLVVSVFGFIAIARQGTLSAFIAAQADKLHMAQPIDHPEMPWTVLLLGIWIPNVYYWGLNQFIAQRALGAKSVAEGQKGVILAAFIKLFLPLIIILPGIMALQLFGDQIQKAGYDHAYPILVKNLIPVGLKGLIFAAMAGAIVSTLNSVVNSASTIFTIDIYQKYIKKDASSHASVVVGRIVTAVFLVLSIVVAILLAKNPGMKDAGIFKYLQEFQGFISPGIVAVFVFGLLVKKAPPAAGIAGIACSIVTYAVLMLTWSSRAFLDRMAVTFLVCVLLMAVITAIAPLKEPKTLPVLQSMDTKPHPWIKAMGGVVIAIAVSLYIIFW